ncbi:STIMATE family [Phytophthora infestans]|nr:STIMATE family [Phytophthora infestans]KAF4132392.1 STIMATE family [Phytophthora infestans]
MASAIRLGSSSMEGGEDSKPKECELLSGDFAVLLQVLLGFIAISVLAIKRLREVPQRPLTIWAFDASKQMVGATFAHVANLFIAIVLFNYQKEMESGEESVDQCALYFVNFTLDTTLGVFLNYVLLSAVVLLALRFSWSSLKTPGDYGTPVRVRTWILQVLSWILVIFTCKFLIALLIVAFQKPLGAFAVLLFKPLADHPDVELAIVMIACPCLMNALQFWVQDNFLKKDVRDESFIVAQAAQSPTGSLNGDGKLPSLGTPTDDECSEPGEGDPKLIVALGNSQEPGEKKLKLDLSSV